MQEREDEQDSSSKTYNPNILGTYEEIYGTKSPIAMEEIFNKCTDQIKKVLVLGRAGIGKSTFCQYATFRWAKGEIWSEYALVLLIYLRKLTIIRYPTGTKYTLRHLLENEYYPCEDLSNEQIRYFQELCREHRVLWILDGYDEFAESTSEHLRDVFDHICQTQHHILTSRPFAIRFEYDVKMEIIGFTDDNITKYAEQFFDQKQNQEKGASLECQKLLQFLKSNSNHWGVAHIPVNLELICSLWSESDWSEKKVLTITSLYDNITEW
ncbi:unnamed protein product [Rotaria sp. Silwood2]|nr:unnamed protein product [Rotaria sp. Silwood2]CAF3099092.1 unnamed protein product [Rotaria sp. Silwood2]CAF3410185.1 unnamed protein product [Rotaria sp. Silwood2]